MDKKQDQDSEHLKLLSIFHYVVAGMLAVFSLFPIMHVAVGIAVVSGAFDDIEQGEGPPAIFGWVFILFPGAMILFGLTLAACMAMAGRCLAARRRYTFCLVMAGIVCLFMPVGTVLGVFTIIVLIRPSVKERFDVKEVVDPPFGGEGEASAEPLSN